MDNGSTGINIFEYNLVVQLRPFVPSDKTQLWYKDAQQDKKLWFEVGTQVVGLKAFSKQSQMGM